MAKDINKSTNHWWKSGNGTAKPLTVKSFKKLWDNMVKKPSCKINPTQCLVSDITYEKMKSGELPYCPGCLQIASVHF